MGKKGLAIVLVMCATTLMAQEETLLRGPVAHGGFGGPVFGLTQIGGEPGVLTGGYGGWIINHTVFLGGGGYGLVNEIDAGTTSTGDEMYMNFGYGGFQMGMILGSNRLVHLTGSDLLGTGALGYRQYDLEDWEDILTDDIIYVIEPAVNVELNVTKFFRVDVGASYRYVMGVDLADWTNEDLSGLSAMLMFKFGKF
jgi:hypothetical protein